VRRAQGESSIGAWKATPDYQFVVNPAAGKTVRTVLNLGRRDLLTAHLDLVKLMRLMATQFRMTLFGTMTFARLRARDWGPITIRAAVPVIRRGSGTSVPYICRTATFSSADILLSL
jgi:hypothetical protein